MGNGDLGVALKAVDMCNRYGMDVISTSECISFAMECHERGIISRDEADGLDLGWGNATILALVEKIAQREGFGDVLADGVRSAAARIGRGSEGLAMHARASWCSRPTPGASRATRWVSPLRAGEGTTSARPASG